MPAPTATFPSPFGTSFRTLMRDGQPWFIAMDVCNALGTETKDVRAILDSSAVSTLKVQGKRGRPALLVNESGFYKLVLKSRKPEAHKFQDWVTGVVLPAIRKDGGYILGEEKVATGEMDDDELLARALQVSARKLERISQECDRATILKSQHQAQARRLEAPSAHPGAR